jgi:hypothetical protein
MRTEARTLNAVAGAALSVLLAAISSSPAVAQYDTDNSERYTVRARRALYTVLDDPSKEYLKCLYRNRIKLLCATEGDFIAFEKHVKIKDYDLIVLSTGGTGSGTRWWDWKLIVEDGNKGTIKAFAHECLECDIHVERLRRGSNQVDFVYRQEQHRISAHFRAGQLSMRKSRLDPHEPLDKETCDGLYQSLEMCKSNSMCSIGGSTAGHFFLLRTADRYAGFSGEAFERQCKAACSTGKAMDRSTFFKKVCRR